MKTSSARKGTKHTTNRNPRGPKKALPQGNPSSARGDIPQRELDAPRAAATVGPIQWPTGWASTEGWPSESDTTLKGETFGELAARAGTTVEAVSRKLGKGAS